MHTRVAHVRIPSLTEQMVEQLFSDAGLPCGQYTVRARTAGHSGRVELFVDGAPMRSGLKRGQACRAAAAFRMFSLEGWM